MPLAGLLLRLPLLLLLLLLRPGPADAALPVQKAGCSVPLLADLYGDNPYPPRDPRDEIPGHVAFPTYDDPSIVSHVGFGGRFDWLGRTRPYRVLVAGGGTGDTTVQMAVLLEQAGVEADIVQVDLSMASLRVAERRLARHPLTKVNVSLRHDSLLALTPEALGTFDYVNCVGVAHHTPDPTETLRSLARMLEPQGVLLLGVYGALGRSGVYELQDLLRRVLGPGAVHDEARVRAAVDVVLQLPETNLFRRNALMYLSADMQRFDRTGMADMLLNPCDVAYTFPQLEELAAAAGLRVQDVSVPSAYEPLPTGSALADAAVAGMRWQERAAVAELQSSRIGMHSAFLVRESHPFESARSAAAIDRDTILCPHIFSRNTKAVGFQEGLRDASTRYVNWTSNLLIYSSQVVLPPLPALAPVFLQANDCVATLEQMHARLLRSGQLHYPLSYDEFERQAREMYELTAHIRMFGLLREPVPMQRYI